MPERKFTAGTSYRYGFNGKEDDSETSSQDYGMRIYNPRVGRFLTVDPITSAYSELTPYQFGSNSPILNIDLDGLEGYSYNGKYIVHDNIPRVVSSGVIDLQSQKPAAAVVPEKLKAERLTSLRTPMKAKTQQVLSQMDTSPGAEMRRQAFREQAQFAERVGTSMKTPEGAAGMGLAMTAYNSARAPVDAVEYSYNIYTGIQDKDVVKTGLNSVGLALTVFPYMKDPKPIGSGPVSGVLEVNINSKSVEAFARYSPKAGMVEFVFDPSTSRFLVGKPNVHLGGSPHQQLVKAGGLESNSIVGGMFKRGPAGEILTSEFSGHYWKNWTPEIRNTFKNFLESKTGQKVLHNPGM